MSQEEREYMEADAAFDRAETLRWKRELEQDELPSCYDASLDYNPPGFPR